MTVIDYVTKEVVRQGHNVLTLDGIERVGWMLDGWAHALRIHDLRKPTVADVTMLGTLVERNANVHGTRTVGVTVGGRVCPRPEKVNTLLVEWGEWVRLGVNVEPFDAYRRLLEIHPFVDGNGRTGKIILNWLNGSLLSPEFPPDDFWGRPIRNP